MKILENYKDINFYDTRAMVSIVRSYWFMEQSWWFSENFNPLIRPRFQYEIMGTEFDL